MRMRWLFIAPRFENWSENWLENSSEPKAASVAPSDDPQILTSGEIRTAMAKLTAPTRADYRWFTPITTRWSDNDIYGHVNNVIYYSYFDSVANRYLIEEGGLDIHTGDTVGLVVNSGCSYHAPIAYPQPLEGGLRVDRLGNSSVQYGLAIFVSAESQACANGTFTHVFVNRQSNRPVPIPPRIREALASVQV